MLSILSVLTSFLDLLIHEDPIWSLMKHLQDAEECFLEDPSASKSPLNAVQVEKTF